MNIKKLISMITSLCFLFSVIGPDIASASISEINLKTYENSTGFVPVNLGRVIESRSFDGYGYTVVNIQDLHCHTEVQKNISSIIADLKENYNISAVFAEGGYENIDLSVFNGIEDEKLKEALIEAMINKGRLTGTEYFFLKNESEIPFLGLEDKDIHTTNLKRLSAIADNKDAYKETLLKIKNEIEYLKAKNLSFENKKFNKFIADYKEGKVVPHRYYSLLKKYINKISRDEQKYNSFLSVSLEKYPVFDSYCALLKSSKDINFEKAMQEMQVVVGELRSILPYSRYNELSLKTAGFSNIEELSLKIRDISKEYGLQIKESSSLAHLMRYVHANKMLNPVVLLQEERRIIEDIRVSFSNSPTEVEISFLSDFYSYLESFLYAEITSDNYEFFVSEYEQFEKTYKKYAYKNHLTAISEDIAFLTNYYEINKNRNEIFIRNIEKNVNYAGEENNLVIVVTGGFHSEGLNKLFSDSKISYISVMPSITQATAESDSNYYKFVKNSAAFTSQTLALGLASQAQKPEIAQIMIEAAAAELSNITFDEASIAFLMRNISGALGEDLPYEFNNDSVTVRLSNGSEIILKNNEGRIEPLVEMNGALAQNAASFDLNAISHAAVAAVNASQTMIFSPNAYKTVKNLMDYAARNNLISGDGLIFDIEMDQSLSDKLDNIDMEMLARMPNFVQSAILRYQKRTDRFSSAEFSAAAIAFITAYYQSGLEQSVLDYFFGARQEESRENEVKYGAILLNKDRYELTYFKPVKMTLAGAYGITLMSSADFEASYPDVTVIENARFYLVSEDGRVMPAENERKISIGKEQRNVFQGALEAFSGISRNHVSIKIDSSGKILINDTSTSGTIIESGAVGRTEINDFYSSRNAAKAREEKLKFLLESLKKTDPAGFYELMLRINTQGNFHSGLETILEGEVDSRIAERHISKNSFGEYENSILDNILKYQSALKSGDQQSAQEIKNIIRDRLETLSKENAPAFYRFVMSVRSPVAANLDRNLERILEKDSWAVENFIVIKDLGLFAGNRLISEIIDTLLEDVSVSDYRIENAMHSLRYNLLDGSSETAILPQQRIFEIETASEKQYLAVPLSSFNIRGVSQEERGYGIYNKQTGETQIVEEGGELRFEGIVFSVNSGQASVYLEEAVNVMLSYTDKKDILDGNRAITEKESAKKVAHTLIKNSAVVIDYENPITVSLEKNQNLLFTKRKGVNNKASFYITRMSDGRGTVISEGDDVLTIRHRSLSGAINVHLRVRVLEGGKLEIRDVSDKGTVVSFETNSDDIAGYVLSDNTQEFKARGSAIYESLARLKASEPETYYEILLNLADYNFSEIENNLLSAEPKLTDTAKIMLANRELKGTEREIALLLLEAEKARNNPNYVFSSSVRSGSGIVSFNEAKKRMELARTAPLEAIKAEIKDLLLSLGNENPAAFYEFVLAFNQDLQFGSAADFDDLLANEIIKYNAKTVSRAKTYKILNIFNSQLADEVLDSVIAGNKEKVNPLDISFSLISREFVNNPKRITLINKMPVVLALSAEKEIFIYPVEAFLSLGFVPRSLKEQIGSTAEYVMFDKDYRVKTLNSGDSIVLGSADKEFGIEEGAGIAGEHVKVEIVNGDLVVTAIDNKTPATVKYAVLSERSFNERAENAQERIASRDQADEIIAETSLKDALAKVYSGWDILNSSDREKVEKHIMGLYERDLAKEDVFLSKWEQPELNEEGQKIIDISLLKYTAEGEVLPFEGVTVVSPVTNPNLRNLTDKYYSMVNEWQPQLETKPIRTVPEDSVHMTFYNGIDVSKLNYVEDVLVFKNEAIRREILQALGIDANNVEGNKTSLTEAQRQTIYRVTEKNLIEVMAELEAEGYFNRHTAPQFEIDGISGNPSGPVNIQKRVILMHMRPKNAYDMAVFMHMREKLQARLGIQDYGIPRLHMTLGYFVNPAGSTESFESLKGLISDLNNDIAANASAPENALHLAIDVSYFKDMESFPAVEGGDSFAFKDQRGSSRLTKKSTRSKIKLFKEGTKLFEIDVAVREMFASIFQSVEEFVASHYEDGVTDEIRHSEEYRKQLDGTIAIKEATKRGLKTGAALGAVLGVAFFISALIFIPYVAIPVVTVISVSSLVATSVLAALVNNIRSHIRYNFENSDAKLELGYRDSQSKRSWWFYRSNRKFIHNNSISIEYKNPITLTLAKNRSFTVFSKEDILEDRATSEVVRRNYPDGYDFAHEYYIVGYRPGGMYIHGFNLGDEVSLGTDEANRHGFTFRENEGVSGKHITVKFNEGVLELADSSENGTAADYLNYEKYPGDEYMDYFVSQADIESYRLEKPSTAKRLKGTPGTKWYETKVAIVELFDTIFENAEHFVETHYPQGVTDEIRASGPYNKRLEGISIVKLATRKGFFHGLYVGATVAVMGLLPYSDFLTANQNIAALMVVGLFITGIVASSIAIIKNIIAHRDYNLNNPNARLDKGKNPVLSLMESLASNFSKYMLGTDGKVKQARVTPRYPAYYKQLENFEDEDFMVKMLDWFSSADEIKKYFKGLGLPDNFFDNGLDTVVATVGSETIILKDIIEIMFNHNKQIVNSGEKAGSFGYINVIYLNSKERADALMFVVDFLANYSQAPLTVNDPYSNHKFGLSFTPSQSRIDDLQSWVRSMPAENAGKNAIVQAYVENASHFMSEDVEFNNNRDTEDEDSKKKGYIKRGLRYFSARKHTRKEFLADILDNFATTGINGNKYVVAEGSSIYVVHVIGNNASIMFFNRDNKLYSKTGKEVYRAAGFKPFDIMVQDLVVPAVAYARLLEGDLNSMPDRVKEDLRQEQVTSYIALENLFMRLRSFKVALENLHSNGDERNYNDSKPHEKNALNAWNNTFAPKLALIQNTLNQGKGTKLRVNAVERIEAAVREAGNIELYIKDVSDFEIYLSERLVLDVREIKKENIDLDELFGLHKELKTVQRIDDAISSLQEYGSTVTVENVIAYYIHHITNMDELSAVTASQDRILALIYARLNISTTDDLHSIIFEEAANHQFEIINDISKSFQGKDYNGILELYSDEILRGLLIENFRDGYEKKMGISFGSAEERMYDDLLKVLIGHKAVENKVNEAKEKLQEEKQRKKAFESALEHARNDAVSDVMSRLSITGDSQRRFSSFVNFAVALTLPETERVIAERGYTGIKKYLYAGVVELKKLLFMSSEDFAALHNNFNSKFLLEKRIKRVNIVKGIVIGLALAAAVAVSIACPFAFSISAPLAIQIAVQFSFTAGIFAASAGFFGIIVHAVNNFIEDTNGVMRKKQIFTLFSEEDLDSIINKYAGKGGYPSDETIAEDIDNIVKNKAEIINLFARPNRFENGIRLKFKMQILVEMLCFAVGEGVKGRPEHNRDFSEFIFEAAEYISSSVIQSYIYYSAILYLSDYYIDSIDNPEILKSVQKRYDAISQLLYLNGELLGTDLKLVENGFSERIENQSLFSSFLINFASYYDHNPFSGINIINNFFKSVVVEKVSGNYTAQLFIEQYIKHNGFSEDFLKQFLSEKEYEKYEGLFYRYSNDGREFIKALSSEDIPYFIPLLNMKTSGSIKSIYDVLIDDSQRIENRLYALKVLSELSVGSTPAIIMQYVFDKGFGGRSYQSAAGSETEFLENSTVSNLKVHSEDLLEKVLSGKYILDKGFFSYKEAEVLFTAAVLDNEVNDSAENVLKVLRKLNYSVSDDKDANLIVTVFDGGAFSRVTLPLDDTKKYIENLKQTVKAISEDGTPPGAANASGNFKINLKKAFIVPMLILTMAATMHGSRIRSMEVAPEISVSRETVSYEATVADSLAQGSAAGSFAAAAELENILNVSRPGSVSNRTKMLLIAISIADPIEGMDWDYNSRTETLEIVMEEGKAFNKREFIEYVKKRYKEINSLDQIIDNLEIIEDEYVAIKSKIGNDISSVDDSIRSLDRSGGDAMEIHLLSKGGQDTTLTNAILPENKEYVQDLVNKGSPAFVIALKVAFKEFFDSLRPDFDARHNAPVLMSEEGEEAPEARTGAEIIDFSTGKQLGTRKGVFENIADKLGLTAPAAVQGATIAGAGMGLMAAIQNIFSFIFFPGNMILNVIIGLVASLFTAVVAGTAANVVTHVGVNYRYIKEQIALRDLARYGVQATGDNISVHVSLTNQMPVNPEEFGFENSGIKVDGKSVWISAKTRSIVVFVESDNFTEMEAAVKNKNRKINEALSRLIKENVGIDIPADNIEIEWINIDYNNEETSIGYDERGEMRVNLSGEDSQFRADFADFITGLRAVQGADKAAAVQNIYYFLDNLENISDLSSCLDDFQKVGNGQIILDYGILENNLDLTSIQKFFDTAHANGVKIIADLTNSYMTAQDCINVGFDGYMATNVRGNLYIHDFAQSTETGANMVENYTNSRELAQRLGETQGIKILRNSQIVETLSTGDRSIIDRLGFINILKGSRLLGILKKDMYSANFIRNAAYNLKEDYIPSVTDDELKGELVRALSMKNVEKAGEILGVASNHALSAYMDKIYSNIDNKFEARIRQADFLEAVAERMLVQQTVAGVLVNKGFEKTLGKALRIRLIEELKGDDNPYIKISVDNFRAQIKQKYLDDGYTEKEYNKQMKEILEWELDREIKDLAAQGFSAQPDTLALNSIIELIPAIADVRLNIKVSNENLNAFDVRRMKSILSAA